MKNLFFSLCFVGFAACAAQIDPKFIEAIRKVESEGQTGIIIGDSGKALGPLQIHRKAWIDALEQSPAIGGRYADCTNLVYSEQIFRAYQQKYAKKTGLKPENMAKLWNAGPNFKGKSQQYWHKVQKQYKK